MSQITEFEPCLKDNGEVFEGSVDSSEILEPQSNELKLEPFPELVIAKLVSFFDLKEKRRARLVSNIWRYEVERVTNFKGTVSNDNIEYFLTSELSFEEVCIRNLNNKFLFNEIKLQSNLDFPEINSLTIAGFCHSAQWILYILKQVSENVQQLRFDKSLEHMAVETVRSFANAILFKNLNKLSFNMDFHLSADFEAATAIFETLTLSTLDTVEIHLKSPSGYHDLLLTQLCMELYKFLVRHDSSLTSLHCTFETNLTLGRYSEVFNRMFFRVSPQLTNLQTLHFQTSRLEMNELARAIMSETTKLVHLTYIQELNPYWTDEDLFAQVLQNNASTLKSLMVYIELFDTRFLKPCINLKKLHLCADSLSPNTYENFDLENLTECQLELSSFCEDDFSFIINNMSNLSTFTFGPGDYTVGVGICKKIGELLEIKGSKFEHITLQTPRIDLSWFKPCCVLKTLQIGGPTVFVNLFNSGTQNVSNLPTLKSFKIYDNGFSENFAIRLLGLKPSLANIINEMGNDWPTTLKMLSITKKRIPGLIGIIVERYALDPVSKDRVMIATNSFECREMIGIEPTQNQYDVSRNRFAYSEGVNIG